MPKGQYNRSQVGTYYAICTTAECGLLLPVPIFAYQTDPTGQVETEPDFTEALAHHQMHIDAGDLLANS